MLEKQLQSVKNNMNLVMKENFYSLYKFLDLSYFQSLKSGKNEFFGNKICEEIGNSKA